MPIGVYFLVRSHVRTDTAGLIVAGCFSVAWIVIQFVRAAPVDVVGAIVLVGFAVGVLSSTLLGGNAYVLKVRDAFFTALFGVACIVTIYTHDRPALFYVSRYLSAGTDPDQGVRLRPLHELPIGRHTFRVLSVVWGIGLVVEAATRLTLADMLPTGDLPRRLALHHRRRHRRLFAFTALYSRRAQLAGGPRVSDPVPTAAPRPPPDDGSALRFPSPESRTSILGGAGPATRPAARGPAKGAHDGRRSAAGAPRATSRSSPSTGPRRATPSTAP